MGLINAPPSRKLWGGNITVKNGHDDISPWAQMFAEWNWDGLIKPQIDGFVGNGVGLNLIKCVGAIDVVTSGYMTQADYNANWQQLADYVADLGAYLYPVAGDFPHLNGMTDSQIADQVISMLGAIEGRAGIIGCDIIGEANGWTDGSAAARIATIYGLVRSAHPAIPLSCSSYALWTDSAARSWIASIASAVDFLDFHVYAQVGYDANAPIVASDFNYWRATYPDMDIVIGEFGTPESSTRDEQISFAFNVTQAFNVGDAALRGACMWAGFDQNSVSNDMWGMYSLAGEKRQSKVLPMVAVTGGYLTKRN